jgi:hypothetical protein
VCHLSSCSNHKTFEIRPIDHLYVLGIDGIDTFSSTKNSGDSISKSSHEHNSNLDKSLEPTTVRDLVKEDTIESSATGMNGWL